MAGSLGVIASDLEKVVARSAPLIASALGTPLAGVAISLLSSAFGFSTSNTDNMAAMISSDPQAAIKLKELEMQHGETLAQISATTYATNVDDRKNARAREELLHDRITPILALVFVVIYAGVQFAAIYNPSTQDDVISARVQDILVMIISYYFGSANPKNGKV